MYSANIASGIPRSTRITSAGAARPARVVCYAALALAALLAGCDGGADVGTEGRASMPRPKAVPATTIRADASAGGAVPMASVQPAAPQAVAATPIIVDGLEFVVLPPAEVFYYPPGEYLEDGYPVNPPQYVATFERDVKIARRQVSQAEYAACVRAGACKPLDRAFRENTAPDLPAIGISWRDATAYAQWLSQKTGHHFRLPVYEEWVYAAGSAYKEDVLLGNFNPADPAQRWLAEYTLETQRKTSVDPAVRPFGSFGENDRGLLDMAGNVWDWTDTCHTRRKIGGDGLLDATGDNCGIRVTAGPHRSYITDFIRDPKSGACSVGVPPSNLGFRLVLDESAPVQSTGPSLRERLGLG